jgi:hypothetical protein
MTSPRASIVVCVGILLTMSRVASAQLFMPTGRDTLKQLPGIELLVEPIEPEFERAGLTTNAVGRAVDARLRAAKIVVYSSQSENPSPAKPYLYVQVSGLEVGQQGFALALQVQLRQTVLSPVTNSSIVNAMTWDRQTVVFAPPNEAAAVVPEIESLVAAFVKDWTAVHQVPPR